MQLSEHFSLQELVKSSLADRLGIDNTPSPSEKERLKATAENILEPLREHYGVAFTPSSGFRCLELNRALKSKDTSQHVTGEAVDIEIPGVSNYDLALWIYLNLDFDQLILEFYQPDDPHSGWVHCSYSNTARRQQVLTFANNSYTDGLIG